jgi:hypothetical protein
VFPAPGARRYAHGFSEGCRELALIGEAACERDLGEACRCVREATLGCFDALRNNILVRRQSRRLFEGAGKMLAGEAGEFGQVVKADIFGEIFYDELVGVAQMSL